MKRREFIALLGGVAAAWPLAAHTQQPAMPAVGYLSSGSEESEDFRVSGFLRGLADAGFAEGRNIRIEYRWADNQAHRLPELAVDLVRHQVAAIVVLGKRSRNARCQGSDCDDSDRVRVRQRSGPNWACQQPEPARG